MVAGEWIADRDAWRQRAWDAEARVERLLAIALGREKLLDEGVAMVEALARERAGLRAEVERLEAELRAGG
jgi:hypothetical protein